MAGVAIRAFPRPAAPVRGFAGEMAAWLNLASWADYATDWLLFN
jgi:hypothetical protein